MPQNSCSTIVLLSISEQFFQQRAKKEATAVIERSCDSILSLEKTYAELFSAEADLESLSAITAAFSSEDAVIENPTCQSAVSETLDVVHAAIADLYTLDRYIQLTLPKKEDGGNFGVEVQRKGVELIETHTGILKAGRSYLLQYSTCRAQALLNCRLPPVNGATSKSSTTTVKEKFDKDSCGCSGTIGNDSGKQGDDCQSSTVTTTRSTEEKVTESVDHPSVSALYKRALVEVDVRNYIKAKSVFLDTITALLLIVDYMDKNESKINAPKGEQDGSSYQH